MTGIGGALWSELLKARRSMVSLMTAIAFSLMPLMGGLFMLIVRNPEGARRFGMIATKAQAMFPTADWPSYFGFLAQVMAGAGILLFSIVASWVFGREYADRSAKDLLALPTSRSAVVAAKFIAVAIWSVGLTVLMWLLGLGVGAVVGLSGMSPPVFLHGASTIAIIAGLTIVLVAPTAFIACVGRGYLLPIGFAIVMLVLAQVFGGVGWAAYFPWAIPGFYYSLAGNAGKLVAPVSYIIVFVTGLAGVIATLAWWRTADQA